VTVKMIDARVWHDEVDCTVKLVVEICCNCAVPFAMPASLRREALADHSISFYCPHGHGQHYVGKTDAEREHERRVAAERRAELAEDTAKRQRERASAAERSATAYKGVATRMRNRIGKGTCPCCHRHFANVERHMDSQHPDWAVQDQ
jgi:hypothetical protein